MVFFFVEVDGRPWILKAHATGKKVVFPALRFTSVGGQKFIADNLKSFLGGTVDGSPGIRANHQACLFFGGLCRAARRHERLRTAHCKMVVGMLDRKVDDEDLRGSCEGVA